MTMPVSSTVRALLEEARAKIDSSDAELLLAHALGRPRGWLYAHADAAVAADEAGRFEALVERRARGEPVAYLCGRRGFWTLDLAVTAFASRSVHVELGRWAGIF